MDRARQVRFLTMMNSAMVTITYLLLNIVSIIITITIIVILITMILVVTRKVIWTHTHAENVTGTNGHGYYNTFR